MPVTFVPLNQGLSRRNASGLLSMTETVWLRSWRLRASVDPTRPQPMITTCTRKTLHRVGGPPDEDRRRCGLAFHSWVVATYLSGFFWAGNCGAPRWVRRCLLY